MIRGMKFCPLLHALRQQRLYARMGLVFLSVTFSTQATTFDFGNKERDLRCDKSMILSLPKSPLEPNTKHLGEQAQAILETELGLDLGLFR